MLSPWETVLLTVLVLVLMTGMGATLTVESFKQTLRRPAGVIIGLCSQFGWMPLVALILAKIFDLPDELAIILIILGASPGGTTSNLFTYFSRANLALSLSMTAVSTVAAVAMMPLLLFLYGSSFSDASFRIPYGEVVRTLSAILVPVAIGMIIRWRSVRVAKIVERVGAGAGITVLLGLVVNGFLNYNEVMVAPSPALFISAAGLGVAGIAAGYSTARLLRLKPRARRAVALETGIQNSPLAIAVIVLAFPDAQHGRLLWLPMLYALFVLCTATLVTLAWRYIWPVKRVVVEED